MANVAEAFSGMQFFQNRASRITAGIQRNTIAGGLKVPGKLLDTGDTPPRTGAPTVMLERSITNTLEVPEGLVKRVYGFSRPANWDGEGAPGISSKACHDAISLIRMAVSTVPRHGLPRASPSTVRGAVALTWRTAFHSYTVFVRGGASRRLQYQWEMPDGRVATGFGGFSRVLEHLASLRD